MKKIVYRKRFARRVKNHFCGERNGKTIGI